jgi:hypothetical protein
VAEKLQQPAQVPAVTDAPFSTDAAPPADVF